MPTARVSGSRTEGFRTAFSTYLKDFCTTVTLIKRTETLDGMGRITSVAEATSTISCDIQWVTKHDLSHINTGDVRVGDGLLFTKYDVDIDIEDEVEFSSVRWRVVSQVEGEQVEGNIVYKGYIIRRNDA